MEILPGIIHILFFHFMTFENKLYELFASAISVFVKQLTKKLIGFIFVVWPWMRSDSFHNIFLLSRQGSKYAWKNTHTHKPPTRTHKHTDTQTNTHITFTKNNKIQIESFCVSKLPWFHTAGLFKVDSGAKANKSPIVLSLSRHQYKQQQKMESLQGNFAETVSSQINAAALHWHDDSYPETSQPRVPELV